MDMVLPEGGLRPFAGLFPRAGQLQPVCGTDGLCAASPQPGPQGKGSPLDNIGFRGLTQGEAAGQGGLIKQLAGKMLQRALEAEMAGPPSWETMRGSVFRRTAGQRQGKREKPHGERLHSPGSEF
jgi:hypothetical protein